METDDKTDMIEPNRQYLLEAAKETNRVNSKEIVKLEQHLLSSKVENKSLQNKENITGNQIINHEEDFHQLTGAVDHQEMSSQVIESNEKILNNKDTTDCVLETCSKTQNNDLSILESLQEMSCIEKADDQVNQHILDLISTDPAKYLSQHASYVLQFEEDDNENITSDDDDWDFDYGYTGDNFIDDLNERQLKSLEQTQIAGKKSSQETEAFRQLTALGKMLSKRKTYFSTLENILMSLSRNNKRRRKEVEDELLSSDKNGKTDLTSSRCTFRKFGMPYFSDNKGFFPPPNQDHQQKIDNDEILTESLPKIHNWIKPHKEALKNAIKRSLIEEQSAKLSKEIDKYIKLLQETMKTKTSEALQLHKKIIEKQNELRDLSRKSLSELVQRYGDNREYDWMKFSVTLFNGLHSADECKNFWNLYLKPGINKDAWSDSEDRKLSKLAAQTKYQDWEKVAKLLGTNRSPFQCFVHYKARLEGVNDFSSGKWTEKEDDKLLSVIKRSKVGQFIPWTKISSYIGNRNHNQIYNRWVQSLNPELVKGKFSKEEDLLIVAGIDVFGVTFKELASLMKNRTTSQLRDRYVRYLQPKSSKMGFWSLEEDENLLKLVEKYGEHSWSKVSGEMKTRNRTQVRHRYGFIQKMRKKIPGWTVSQVKRRCPNDRKNANRNSKDIENIKKDIAKIEKVFQLSDIEKETVLQEKLMELRDKVLSSRINKKGRKKKVIDTGSELTDTILDLFANTYTQSESKSVKLPHDSTSIQMNEPVTLKCFFGHELELPKSEKEINDNPRLNSTAKSLLKCLLNSNEEECPSINFSYQQQCSSLNSRSVENDSLNKIDCPIPEHDDTIIMMDWWHTPPVNVSTLNFSEFFKRTVFDYSNGMHKDIWDSKVKRSRRNKTNVNYSVSKEKEDPPLIQKYNFPPNYCSSLCSRSIWLSKPILEIQTREMDILKRSFNDFVKKEEDEERDTDDVEFKFNTVSLHNVHNACSVLQDDLQTVFSWSRVLASNNIGTVPLRNVQFSQKKVKARRVDRSSETVIDRSEGSTGIQNEQTPSTSDISQEIVLPLSNGKPNRKRQVTEKEVTHKQSEHVSKKMKMNNESLESIKEMNHKKDINSSSEIKGTTSTTLSKNRRAQTPKSNNPESGLQPNVSKEGSGV